MFVPFKQAKQIKEPMHLRDVDEYLLDGLIHEELGEVLCRNNADLIRSLPF